jgi:hypothetical protein
MWGGGGAGMAGGPPLAACFNAFFKITPDVFDLWLSILVRVPSAVLVFGEYQYHTSALKNLRAAAEEIFNVSTGGGEGGGGERERERKDAYGLASARQRMASVSKTKTLDDHIRRASLASIFLDTRLYNAHTLAVDMLWAGVPLVTYPDTSLASRVSTSLLLASKLPATVARSSQDYIEIASRFLSSTLPYSASPPPSSSSYTAASTLPSLAANAVAGIREKFNALRFSGMRARADRERRVDRCCCCGSARWLLMHWVHERDGRSFPNARTCDRET